MGYFLVRVMLALFIVSLYFFLLAGAAVIGEKPKFEALFMRISGIFGLLVITLAATLGLYLIFTYAA